MTLHTAAQHEEVQLQDVEICPCVWWPRGRPHGAARRAAIAARLAAVTLPHLHRAIPRGALVHLQGGVASGALTVLTLAVANRRDRAIVYSPHNTFSRRGRFDGLLLSGALLFTQSTVAYSQIDVATLRSRGAHATRSPLIQLLPEPTPDRMERWREAWGAGEHDQVVLFAGVVRPDKRLDVLVRAARGWPASRRLAVVGQDRGELARCRALAAELGVELHAHDEYVSLEDFTAALAAADVVVAPYERASQSGVLSVASQLGTATIASNVGGLSELADRTFEPGDPAALAQAIDAQLASGASGRRPLDAAAALRAHEAAYRHARAAREEQRRCSSPARRRRARVAFVVWGPIAGRAEEFANALDGDHRVYFDLGIVDRRAIPLRYLLSATRMLWYLVRTRPRSLIVTNPPIVAAVVGFAYARLAKIPLVLDSHPISFGQKANRIGRFFLPLHAALARRATTTLVGTDALARRVEAWGARADIVHEAPPVGPPPEAARSGPRTSHTPAEPRPPVVLWSGIFAADEPFAAVIEAIRLLPDVELHVAGDLRRCPIDPGDAPPNVRWLGFLAGESYRRALHGADVVLALTNDSTSAMRAAAEAVYAGKPLITSDLEHLAALFPSALPVRNDAAAIAEGIRAAVAERDRLAADSEAMRELQLARWDEQRRMLLERLGLRDDDVPEPVAALEAAR